MNLAEEVEDLKKQNQFLNVKIKELDKRLSTLESLISNSKKEIEVNEDEVFYSWILKKNKKNMSKKIDKEAYFKNKTGVPKKLFEKIKLNIETEIKLFYKNKKYRAEILETKVSGQLFLNWKNSLGEEIRKDYPIYNLIFKYSEKNIRERVELFLEFKYKEKNEYEIIIKEKELNINFDYSWSYIKEFDIYLKQMDKSIFHYNNTGIPLGFKDKIIKGQFLDNKIHLEFIFKDKKYKGEFLKGLKTYNLKIAPEISEKIRMKYPKISSFYLEELGKRRKNKPPFITYMVLKYVDDKIFAIDIFDEKNLKKQIKSNREELRYI